ncbi:MAG: hypothetical protein HY866_03575, partial [Chloroflexi bacterium]|nr:hypothetical protein [Chloroflexota bacterium]
TGSCNLIGQTQAGGIIAPAPGFVQTVPTPNPGTTDPNAPPAPPAAAGDVNLVPRSGTWYGTTADELLMSCEGGDTIRVPFDSNLGRVSIFVSGGGDTLTINDGWDTFPGTRQSPGYYTANMPTYDTDMYAVWYLHVTSPTTMNTELMVGFLSIPCSGTALVSLSFVG